MSRVQFINTNNLRIARENVGLTTKSASRIISNSKKDLVAEWENGESLPTWSQIKRLSKSYNIPDLLFFSKETIQKDKVIPDYRVGIYNNGDEKVKKLINLTITRQRWIEKKFKEENFPKNKLQGSGKNIQDPKELANFITRELDIKIDEIKNTTGYSARKKVLDYLIKKAEDHSVFVGKTISYHKLEVKDMRGLFISNDHCPFIILNRRDALSAQIFSFIHELAHLFRKSDSISNSLDFRSQKSNSNPEEIFCNKVAAELLLPEKDFVNQYYDKSDIQNFSEIYKVSEICIFYRLSDLGKIRKEIHSTLEKEIQDETNRNIAEKIKKDKEKSGGNYYNSMRDSNGDFFNLVVAESYFEHKIDYVEASNLLRFSVEMV